MIPILIECLTWRYRTDGGHQGMRLKIAGLGPEVTGIVGLGDSGPRGQSWPVALYLR